MKYANKREIPYVAIIGESELQENVVSIKNMITGEQQRVAAADIMNFDFR